MTEKRRRHKFRLSYQDRRNDWPTLSEATKDLREGYAGIFYEGGFFALVWIENGIRYVRDLKNYRG